MLQTDNLQFQENILHIFQLLIQFNRTEDLHIIIRMYNKKIIFINIIYFKIQKFLIF